MFAITQEFDSQECSLPSEVEFMIFSHLDGRTAHLISGVCRKWRDLVKPDTAQSLWKKIFYRNFVFCGPKEWKKEIGDPGPVPAIDYNQAVKEAHIFSSKWPPEWDKKMCFLQPKDILPIDEESRVPLTARKIGELVAPKLGPECDPTGYNDDFWVEAFELCGDTPIQETCWVYMTPNIIPDSRGRVREKHEKLLADFGGEVPRFVCAVTALFLQAACTGKLFGTTPWTYIRCQEIIGRVQLVVGGFIKEGLSVPPDYGDYDCGFATLLQFKAIRT
jgi:hypothetical protein